MKLERVVMAAVTFSLSAAVQAADDSHAYLLATVGIAKYEADAFSYYEDRVNYLRKTYEVAASTDNDDMDTGFNLGGGFQVSRHWAVEGFYRSYGGLRAGMQASSMGSGRGLMSGTHIQASGPGIAVLGLLPVNAHLRYYLRLDAISLKLEDKTYYQDSLGRKIDLSSDDTRTTPGVAVGGRYDLAQGWNLQMDMQFLRGKIGYAGGTSDKVNINTLGIGVLKTF